jgi:hypothetical protein
VVPNDHIFQHGKRSQKARYVLLKLLYKVRMCEHYNHAEFKARIKYEYCRVPNPFRIHFLYCSQQYSNDPGSRHTEKTTSTVTTANNKVESMRNSAVVAWFRVTFCPFAGWMRKNQRKVFVREADTQDDCRN